MLYEIGTDESNIKELKTEMSDKKVDFLFELLFRCSVDRKHRSVEVGVTLSLVNETCLLLILLISSWNGTSASFFLFQTFIPVRIKAVCTKSVEDFFLIFNHVYCT